MKFELCGLLEAPSWFLLGVGNLEEYSDLDDIRQILDRCVLEILESRKNDGKSSNIAHSAKEKTVVPVLHYVLFNSIKYQVKPTVLKQELLQLGFSFEICALILEFVQKFGPDVAEKLKTTSLRLSRLAAVDDTIILKSSPGTIRVNIPIFDNVENFAKPQLNLNISETVIKAITR